MEASLKGNGILEAPIECLVLREVLLRIQFPQSKDAGFLPPR